MRALRHGVERTELIALLCGGAVTVTVALATVQGGVKLGTGPLLAAALLCVLVASWLVAPQVLVAVTIPLFALLPTLKVFVSQWLGPVKDFVTLAAAIALLITILMRSERVARVDRLLIWLMVAFGSLYVINVGGLISGDSHGIAWAQGVRLTGEPLILLAAGLTARNPRRTLGVAVTSLVATGVFVALYGMYQQMLGGPRLVELGYSYRNEIRLIGTHLRSFGTLGEPFAYAAFLLLAIAAALFWMRRGPLKIVCLTVMTIGLTLSYVRSAILISVALLALWLIRNRRVTLGFVLLAASLAAGLAFLVALSGASETHSVRAGPNTYVTLNGRTTVWSTIFSRPTKVPFGLGVAKIGTAAERAQSGVIVDPNAARKKVVAVDSGYFATVADVGLVGLALLLAIFARLFALARSALYQQDSAGWLVLAWLIVLMLDAVTRASFTGFPTAFLGMLLVGLGIAQLRSVQPRALIQRRWHP
jgi:O-antigen ligase